MAVRRGSRTLITATVLVAVTMSGCALPGSDDHGDEKAAAGLAAAMASGELDEIGFVQGSTDAQRRWDRTIGDAEDVDRQIEVVGVTENGDERVATLRWSWDLGEDGWAYDSEAVLVERGDRWLVRFAPTMIEPSLEPGESLDITTLAAKRGDILGSGDTSLVTDRAVLRFGIDKTQVGATAQRRSAGRLAALLGIDRSRFEGRVEQAGREAFVEGLVLRVDDVPRDVTSSYEDIRGAVALQDDIPLAPTSTFARSILGTVGPVTAEILEKSDNAYEAGDEVGLSGLEARYENRLAGTRGVVVEAVEAANDTRRQLSRLAPQDGKPLRTTLDPDLQRAAESSLGEVGPASALVAIRPSDGHVLAAADGPGSDGYATATTGRYPPGSTFKVVSSLALLRAGLTTRDTGPCADDLTVEGKSFENYDDYPAGLTGEITMQTALAHSCNTWFIAQRGKTPQSSLSEAAASLGLGVDHDLGVPAYLGSVPTEAGATEHAASMIGQGKVLASPLAMATVAASIQDGRTVVPLVLVGRRTKSSAPPLTASEAEQLRTMMRTTVTSGSGRFLDDVPGAGVRAKTGTAEFGTQSPPQTHAWMIATQGDLAVAAFVEVGESGSHTAGPVLEKFLRAVG